MDFTVKLQTTFDANQFWKSENFSKNASCPSIEKFEKTLTFQNLQTVPDFPVNLVAILYADKFWNGAIFSKK